jgi:hypothetical protein
LLISEVEKKGENKGKNNGERPGKDLRGRRGRFRVGRRNRRRSDGEFLVPLAKAK